MASSIEGINAGIGALNGIFNDRERRRRIASEDPEAVITGKLKDLNTKIAELFKELEAIE